MLFQVYAERLADRLYEMGLLKKAWSIWYSASHKKWKDTMEKACQSSAESVRVELSSSYECKISEVNRLLNYSSLLNITHFLCTEIGNSICPI